MRRFNCFLLFIFSLAALPTTFQTASAQEPVGQLSLDEYWQKLEETLLIVEELDVATPEVRRNRLAAAADEWTAVHTLVLDDGSTLPIDTSFLAGRLRADPPNMLGLRNHLNAQLAARDTWPENRHTPADLDSLREILSRGEFGGLPDEEPSRLAQWWQDVRRRIGQWFDNVLPEISISIPFLDEIITAFGAVALILVLLFALRDLLRDLVVEAELPTAVEDGDELLSAEAALQRAQSYSGSGDYRTAVRYLYLSTLFLLEERGLLRYDRSRTNREYLTSIRHKPELVAVLREVIDIFDRVWYGFQPLNARDYARYEEQVQRLRRQQS